MVRASFVGVAIADFIRRMSATVPTLLRTVRRRLPSGSREYKISCRVYLVANVSA